MGVFLEIGVILCMGCGLPHARGGVSSGHSARRPIQQSSPRPWGCFQSRWRCSGTSRVFPTPVGVFPQPRLEGVGGRCLPHARGGVSTSPSVRCRWPWSSPRPWGCFSDERQTRRNAEVFPTPVGVFLQRQVEHKRIASLPHTRGLATLHDVRWKRLLR